MSHSKAKILQQSPQQAISPPITVGPQLPPIFHNSFLSANSPLLPPTSATCPSAPAARKGEGEIKEGPAPPLQPPPPHTYHILLQATRHLVLLKFTGLGLLLLCIGEQTKSMETETPFLSYNSDPPIAYAGTQTLGLGLAGSLGWCGNSEKGLGVHLLPMSCIYFADQ